MKLRYTDSAKEDLDQAVEWYEQKRKGLGLEFLDALQLLLRNILEHPKMYAVRYADYHVCAMKKFPLSIFYTSMPEEIIIHAVFHNRLNPDKRPLC